MSALRVGMRVRLVNSIHPECNGDTGVFEGLIPDGGWDGLFNCRVCWDKPSGYGPLCHTDRLEPLTPPPQLADWDSDEMPCDRNGKCRQPEYAA